MLRSYLFYLFIAMTSSSVARSPTFTMPVSRHHNNHLFASEEHAAHYMKNLNEHFRDKFARGGISGRASGTSPLVNQNWDSSVGFQCLRCCRPLKYSFDHCRSYYASISVGTPPVVYEVSLDTGLFYSSTLLCTF